MRRIIEEQVLTLTYVWLFSNPGVKKWATFAPPLIQVFLIERAATLLCEQIHWFLVMRQQHQQRHPRILLTSMQ